MHAAVNFQVYGIIGYPSSFCLFDKSLKDTEVVELGLQIVGEEIFKTVHLRVKHDQGERDPFISEQDRLFCHGHGQIVAPVILQRLGNLHSTCAITVCLHHTDELHAGLQSRFIEVEIVHNRIQIYLQHRFMNTLLNESADFLEMISAGTLQQDQLLVERFPFTRQDEVLSRCIEHLFRHGEQIGIRRDMLPYPDYFLYPALFNHPCHFFVK